jgi:long-chain acyl-CoA synthetase
MIGEALVAAAARFPRKRAVAAEDGEATYAQLLDRALRLAAGFRACGVRPGDRVVLFMDNTLAAATAIYAALFAGAVFVTVNSQTKRDRLAYIVDDSGASLVVAEGALAAVAAAALAVAAATPRLVCAGSAAPVGAVVFDELLAHEPLVPEPAGELAALVYTSGTTGVPKGVMLTHDGVSFAVDGIADYLRLREDDRILSVLPLAFTYGLSQLLLSVRLGATLLLERSFAYPARTLQRLREEQATVFPGVPTIFSTLASLAASGPVAFPGVRCVTNAAAGLPPALHEPIGRIFPNAALFRMYGQTECIRACYLPPELVEAKPGSVGRAIPGTELLLLDADGRRVGPGEVGVLHVRGPHVMRGYWRAPELTAEALPEPGLLCTHDLFTIDADGDLSFVARRDEIIKTRGEKVSPAEVEAVLFALEGVREAAVVGVADERLGDAIRAFVVCEEGAKVSARQVIRHCREHLALYAVPADVVFVDRLPRTPSGKLERRSLVA